jgi:DNA-binding MarR family transcriptional regulator
VSGTLVDALLRASRGLVGIAAASIAEEPGVTLVQYRALVVIGGVDACTVSDLAIALEVHPTTATRLVERLVAKDLVDRREGVPDRRTTVLHLTTPGQQLVRRVLTRRRLALESIVDRLGDDVSGHAVEALERLADATGEGSSVDLFGWQAPS